MHEQATATGNYITLTEAAKIAPGRPSTNCVWRWCRRGVKSRNGERVRLQHLRIGGMIYTTPGWLEQFGRALADADAKYFDLCEAAADASAAAPRRRRRVSQSRFEEQRREQVAAARRELDEAGY
ncbi:MAG TPA: hypothetical protein PLP66_03580 [Phycisphaerae bacterium]|nr:DUF1580 domain-containing protein [Phycisphaerae bacterium]HPM22957.1 hypothetical protein [Phycisphaerae bacterium]HQL53995.1 hypothetical protein [Phycisphaerae bacterium]